MVKILGIKTASVFSLALFGTSALAFDLGDAFRVLDPGGAIIRDVIEGKSPEQAVEDTVKVIVETHVEVVETVVDAHGKLDAEIIDFVRDSLGDDIANALGLAQMIPALSAPATL